MGHRKATRMFGILLALTLSTALLPAGAQAGGATTDLTDIAGHWAAAEIQSAVTAGWVNGYPDQTFRPEAYVTRAEFLKMLTLARGESAAESPIRDQRLAFLSPYLIEQNHWAAAAGYIRQALSRSILEPADYPFRYSSSGQIESWSLQPDQRLTRDEAAVFVSRALGLKYEAEAPYLYPGSRFAAKVPQPVLSFTDSATLPDWLKGWVGAASRYGIINGYPDGAFHGDQPIKRSEAVVMLKRYAQATAPQAAFTAQIKPLSADKMDDLTAQDPRRFTAFGDVRLTGSESMSVAEVASAWYRLPLADKEAAMKAQTVAFWDQVQAADLGELRLEQVWVTIWGPNSVTLGYGHYDGQRFWYEDMNWHPEPLLVNPALESSLIANMAPDSARTDLDAQVAWHRQFVADELDRYREKLSQVNRQTRFAFPYQYLGDWFQQNPASMMAWAETHARAYYETMKPQVEAMGGTLAQVTLEVAPSDTADRAGRYRSLQFAESLLANPVLVITFDGAQVTAVWQPSSLAGWLADLQPSYQMVSCGEGNPCPDVNPPVATARRMLTNFVYTLGGQAPSPAN